jgi:hypothetical protein
MTAPRRPSSIIAVGLGGTNDQSCYDGQNRERENDCCGSHAGAETEIPNDRNGKAHAGQVVANFRDAFSLTLVHPHISSYPAAGPDVQLLRAQIMLRSGVSRKASQAIRLNGCQPGSLSFENAIGLPFMATATCMAHATTRMRCVDLAKPARSVACRPKCSDAADVRRRGASGMQRRSRYRLYGAKGNSNSWGSTPRARANRSRLSSAMFRACRSTWATNVRCKPDSKASTSCDQPFAYRSATMFAASNARALSRRRKTPLVFTHASVKVCSF